MVMYGPAYFSREFSRQFLPVLEAYYKTPGTEQFYWEQVYVDMLEGEPDGGLRRKAADCWKQPRKPAPGGLPVG